MNVAEYIKAKSDQLNADDLIGGPITVQVAKVMKGNAEQPVVMHISGGHCPFKPSKTALRVLAHAWGPETDAWVGRWMELYRDEGVRWAGHAVGGIRISGLSDIAGPITLALAESKGKKKAERVRKLTAPKQDGAPTADLDRLLSDAGVTREDCDRWLVGKGKAPLSERTPEAAAEIAAWLAARPEVLASMVAPAEAEAPSEDTATDTGEAITPAVLAEVTDAAKSFAAAGWRGEAAWSAMLASIGAGPDVTTWTLAQGERLVDMVPGRFEELQDELAAQGQGQDEEQGSLL